MEKSSQFEEIASLSSGVPDDALILAASWEERCLGLTRRIAGYRANDVYLIIYDGESALRTKHIKELKERLHPVGHIHSINASHDNPQISVREIVKSIEQRMVGKQAPKVSIDVSTFTRKHLLQLLQGLDLAGFLGACRFFHTESSNYATQDNDMMADGISGIRAIDSFMGPNRPSHDSVLILFLGYEGGRALAIWEHLEPNVTFAVVPDPPYSGSWKGRTEDQNRYLLSSIPGDHVRRSHSLVPESSSSLLEELIIASKYGRGKYRFQIATLGTKAQTVGLYRFWRKHPHAATVVYADPKRYRQERANFPPGRTWLIANSTPWGPMTRRSS